jgi:hypothetical protein
MKTELTEKETDDLMTIVQRGFVPVDDWPSDNGFIERLQEIGEKIFPAHRGRGHLVVEWIEED